ncbi:hypothetical protein [Sphingomonas sp. PB4P5]|uniref:hypothetical protein n=1 Tax=Parasphingomonas puruogangriensis TaxID=3096155 RepID=UPI002FCC3D82
MRYFKQGQHDGLCGFYAALNAFRYIQHTAKHILLREEDAAFYDEGVECLARVPGIDIRVLKSNSAIGGIDQFQIRDLCRIFAERIDLDISIELIGHRQRMSFSQRYGSLWAHGKAFAVIAAHRDGSHWVVAARHQTHAYQLIDNGRSQPIALRGGDGPQLATDAAVVLTFI